MERLWTEAELVPGGAFDEDISSSYLASRKQADELENVQELERKVLQLHSGQMPKEPAQMESTTPQGTRSWRPVPKRVPVPGGGPSFEGDLIGQGQQGALQEYWSDKYNQDAVLNALGSGWSKEAIEAEYGGGQNLEWPLVGDPVDLVTDIVTGGTTFAGRAGLKTMAEGGAEAIKAGAKQVMKGAATDAAMGQLAGGFMAAADKYTDSGAIQMLTGLVGPTAALAVLSTTRNGLKQTIRRLQVHDPDKYRQIMRSVEEFEDSHFGRTMQELAAEQAATAPPDPMPAGRAMQAVEGDVGRALRDAPYFNQGMAEIWAATPGLAFGFERDEDGTWGFNPDKAVLGMVAAGTGNILVRKTGLNRLVWDAAATGIETPTDSGKFLRGVPGRLAGADPLKSVKLSKTVFVPEWDGVSSLAEAKKVSGMYKWLMPQVVSAESHPELFGKGPVKTLRWRANDRGFYGNKGKMAFRNGADPQGRNTWEWAGCGRSEFARVNGLTGVHPEFGFNAEWACYGGRCYAEELAGAYSGGSVAENTMVRPVGGAERDEITKVLEGQGVEAAQKRWPDYKMFERQDQYRVVNPDTGKTYRNFGEDLEGAKAYAEQWPGSVVEPIPPERRWSIARVITPEEAEGSSGVFVTTDLAPAKGQDIRLGVDTDGAAWLADPKVMDAILEADPRTLSVYSAGYHVPPQPHPLSNRAIINVTVSGYHPIPETLRRLEWARQARDNGWNVILREVTADPDTFTNAETKLYNRVHDLVMGTDFFVMEQPLHKGAAHGGSAFGLPACCVGSKTNPRTCHDCVVSEGLGKGFQEYWGIGEAEGEKILPGQKRYRGRKLPAVSGLAAGIEDADLTIPTSQLPAKVPEQPTIVSAVPGPYGIVYLYFDERAPLPTATDIKRFIKDELGLPGMHTVIELKGGIRSRSMGAAKFRIDLDRGYKSTDLTSKLQIPAKELPQGPNPRGLLSSILPHTAELDMIGALPGGLAGIEIDDEGNITVDPKAVAVGIGAAALRHQIRGLARRAGSGPASGLAEGGPATSGRTGGGKEPQFRVKITPLAKVTPWEETLGRGKQLPPGIKAKLQASESNIIKDQMMAWTDKYTLGGAGINHERINAPDDIHQLLNEVAAQIPSEIHKARRGEHVTLEDMVGLARDTGISEEHLLKRARGEAWNYEHIIAARWLVQDSANEQLTIAKRIREGDDSSETLLEYRKRAERHAALEAQLHGLAAEAARALNAFRPPVGPGEYVRKEISQMLDHVGGPQSIREAAIAFADAADAGIDAAGVGAMVRAMRKPKWWDVIHEVRIMGLLSGPLTQMRNIWSTLATTLENPMGTRQLAALYGLGFKGIREKLGVKDTAMFLGAGEAGEVVPGEAKAWLHGMWSSQWDCLKMAGKAFWLNESSDITGKAEMPRAGALGSAFFRDYESRKILGRSRLYRKLMDSPFAKAIDALGEVIRVPGRGLIGADEYFKVLNWNAEIHAQSWRKAYNEGLRGPELGARALELARDPTEEMLVAGRQAARDNTYTNDLEGAMRWLQKASQTPFGKIVVPFMRTPWNIARFVNARMPSALIDPAVRADILAGGARRDLAMARITMGTMWLSASAGLAGLGYVTGGGPTDPSKRAVWLHDNQPYSVKVPGTDTWVSYNQVEPFGMLLGLGADAHEILSQWEGGDLEADEFALALAAGFSKNILSKTWTIGLSEALNAMSDPDQNFERWIRGQTAGFLPGSGMLRTLDRFTDPSFRQINSMIDAFKAQIPGWSKDMPARTDIFGYDVNRQHFTPLHLDNWIAPFTVRDIEKDPVVQEMIRTGAGVGRPGKTVTLNAGAPGAQDVDVELTPEERYKYEQLAGHQITLPEYRHQTQRDAIAWLMTRPDYQNKSRDGKAAAIQTVVAKYRAAARKELPKIYSRISDMLYSQGYTPKEY